MRLRIIERRFASKVFKRVFIVLSTFGLFCSVLADGKTYPIVERDAIEEIEERGKNAESIIKKKIEDAQNRFLNSTGEPLKPASKSYSYSIDPSYTVDRDIYYYDENTRQWKVLYPKGYKINSIDYISGFAPDIVVYNPCDKDENKFVENLIRNNPLNYMLVSTGCPVKNIKSNFQVFLLTKELKDKLKLKETVSVASIDKKNKVIVVKVYAVKGGR
jgi:conjugal transfer pilus assembly protein TraW